MLSERCKDVQHRRRNYKNSKSPLQIFTITIFCHLFRFSDVLDVSVEVSVEMPFDIRTIDSPSHSIRIKVSSNFFSLLMPDSEGLLTTEKRLARALRVLIWPMTYRRY